MNTTDPQSFVASCRTAQIAWAKRSVRDRLRIVRELRFLMVERREQLCEAVRLDVGKRPDETITQDILPTAEALKFLEREAKSILKPQRVSHRSRPLFLMGQSDMIHHRPHGIVGIIGTWNYPIFLNAVQIAQALTAGNAVLWKPSEVAPKSATVLHQLLMDAGYPSGLMVTLPATREGGPALLEADIDHLVFTGSANVGRMIAKRLAERLISSTLELSGCDAMFVFGDANIDLAAKGAWFGTTLNRGQTCLATRRVLVESTKYDAFLDRLRLFAETAQPMKLAMRSQVEAVSKLVQQAIDGGAKRLTPATSNAEDEFTPTILIDVKPEMALCREAPFAPVAVVMPFRDLEDALRIEAECPYALGCAIFTGDPSRADIFAERLRPGMVSMNDVIVSTAHPGTPFGGRGSSGWGVTQGPDGLLAMTVPQVVSKRGGTFRPHFDSVQGENLALGDVVEGALLWSHARSMGQQWKGLWRLIRGARRIGKK